MAYRQRENVMNDFEVCIENVPQECIDDCSASGRADDAVAYWLKQEPIMSLFARLNPLRRMGRRRARR
jgi:hypothetical protein